MAGNYAHLFSKYTDEQLLELASQRDTLLDAGKTALDEEMKRRGFDPHELLTSAAESAFAGDEKIPKVNVISSFFLRALQWQIFLLLTTLYSLAIVGVMMSPTAATAQSSKDIGNPGLMFEIPMVLCMLCFLGWLGSTGLFLNRVVHPALGMKPGFFRFSIIYPALYIFAFVQLFVSNNTRLVFIIIPFHLLFMFCMLYTLYFVAKNLVLAETARPVSFYDYAGPFFLIWFIPFGIWVIQPRINRLYQARVGRSANQVATN